jgi:hypothetical protein
MGSVLFGIGGGGGGGFSLFSKSSDGLPAIFTGANRAAAEVAREDYFTNDPSGPDDLATLDQNPFLLIQLIDESTDPDTVIYQNRQGGAWADVNGIVQGPAGNDAPSLFFSSVAERQTFFGDVDNLPLLSNGLPSVTNINGTFTTLVWSDPISPVTAYDDTFWREAPVGASPDSIILGSDGARISSGNQVINFDTPGGETQTFIGVPYTIGGGSNAPFCYNFTPQVTFNAATVDTSNLTDPQDVQADGFGLSSIYLQSIIIKPHETGELRIQAWIGTADTDPKIIDVTQTITGGDVGNETTINIPNPVLLRTPEQNLFRFSGVGLQGGLQTSGQFNGQIVPFIDIGVMVASQLTMVTDPTDTFTMREGVTGTANFNMIDVLLTDKYTLVYADATSNVTQTFSVDSVVNLGANNLDVQQTTGDLSLTQNAVTSFFDLVTATPQGSLTRDQGSLAVLIDGDSSTVFFKQTGTGDTGWTDLLAVGSGDVSGPGVSVTNSIAVFSDTSGFDITGVNQVIAQRVANTTELELVAEVAGSSRIALTPTVGGAGALIQYTQSTGITQIISTNGQLVLATSLATSDIVLEAGSTSSVILENPGANTNPPVQLNVAGIGGATLNIFVSNVNPNGVITADQGDICFVKTGVDDTSAQWIKETGAGTNTGWIQKLSGSTGIAGPSTSTITAIPTFSNTSGDAVIDNPLLTYVSSASSSQLSIQAAATGAADIFIENSGGTAVGLIQNLGNDFRIAALVGGATLELSGLGGVAIASFNGDVVIENDFTVSNASSELLTTLTVPATNRLAALAIDNSTDVEKIRLQYDEAIDTSTLNLNENIQASVDGNQTLLNIKADNVLDTASINFLAPLDIVQLAIQTNVNTQTNSITSSNYPLSILAGGNLTLETGGSNYTRILSVSGGNTVQMLQLDNNGSGGAEVNFYTSLVDPNGVVAGNQGDYCCVATGVDGTSALWIKETGAATNTGWQNLHSVTSGIAGPSTSTAGSLPTFDVTDGSSVQDNPLLTYTSTASTSTLSLQEAATGSADFFFNGGGGSGIGLIQTLGSTFELTSINSNNLTLSSASDLTISSLFGATTMTSGGGTLRVQTTGAHAAIFEASGSGTVDLNANAGTISLINNHGELLLGSVATSITTATGVNFNVDATANGNVNITAEDTITLQTQDTSAVVATVGGGGDTFPIARYTTNGTGGGVFDLHVGDSSPQGRVSGANTLFLQTGAASSGNARIHYQDTDATVTNWNVLTSIGSGDTQDAGTFMHFPGTDLAQGTPTSRMRYFETGVNTDIEIDSGVNGAASFRIKDELSNDRFTFIYNDSVPQATISTVGPVPLNIFASGNLDVTATGTAEISSAQSMTIEATGAGSDITVNANDDMTFFSNDEMNFSCGGLYTSNVFTRFDLICGQFGTLPIINFANNNTQFNLFAYFQTPIGNVTGVAGDVLVRNEGADSNVYIHKNNTPNNTDWRALDAPAIQTWGDASIASTTATRYLTPGYDSGTAPTSPVSYRVPRGGVMQNLYIQCGTANGNGNNVVYSVRVNSIASALSLTLASNIVTGSNQTNRVSVNKGDLIDIVVTKAASIGTSPSDVMASLEIV